VEKILVFLIFILLNIIFNFYYLFNTSDEEYVYFLEQLMFSQRCVLEQNKIKKKLINDVHGNEKRLIVDVTKKNLFLDLKQR